MEEPKLVRSVYRIGEHGPETNLAEVVMSPWHGEADCPQCGGEGTLLVTGEIAMIEIEGCWVCGYGRREESEAEFVPLRKLRVLDQKKNASKGR